MTVSFLAPRISKRVEAHSKTLLLIGTGGLVSLYFFDLLPDVIQLGGGSSLGIIFAVWLLYTLLHVYNLKHHEEHDHPQGHDHGHVHLASDGNGSSFFLLASMVSHCFSSGMLLYLSHGLSAKVAASVFLALIGHKGYEAISVSVLLNQRTQDTKKFATYAVFYASSFPIGVAVTALLTHFFGSEVSPPIVKMVAMGVASVAVGSLAGCMINDFLLHSLRHVRTRRLEAAWMLVGVALTILFTAGA